MAKSIITMFGGRVLTSRLKFTTLSLPLIVTLLSLNISLVFAQASEPAQREKGRILQRLKAKVQERQAEKALSKNSKKSPGEKLSLGGLTVHVWRAKITPSPIIIFSHGFHGCGDQSSRLMQSFADAGYLVLAPDHLDCAKKFPLRPDPSFKDVPHWNESTFINRANDIKNLISFLRRDANWSGLIDWTRLALAGHSLGGYTALGLAGGWPNWKLNEVKAVLALSPYCEPFILNSSLKNITVPIMYQGGSRDFGITPTLKRKSGAYEQTSSPAYLVEFEGAGHFAWTDLNRELQHHIQDMSLRFLEQHVRAEGTSSPIGTSAHKAYSLRVK